MRAQQLAIGVVNLQAVVIENLGRQRIVAPGLEPALVRVMHERRVGELLTPVLVVVEEVEIQALDELAQRRRQGTFLGGALAVGEAHRRVRIAQVQRPDIGHDIAPRGDFDLHAQVGQHARQVGDGLLQRQVLAGNVGTRCGVRAGQQQRLGIGVQVLHLLDHELRPGLHHLLHRAPLDGTQDALAVLFGDIRRQLDLDLEDLLVAVFRVDDVVLRQANVLGGDVARLAVQLHEIRRTQCRRGQKIVERTGGRAIALVANGLVRHHGEVIEFGFEAKVVEKVDLDFHAALPEYEKDCSPLSRLCSTKK